jgi:hypothetical protein
MPSRYAVNATLLFTLQDDDPDPEATAGAIVVVLNHTGEALRETAAIIVGNPLRIAGSKEEEVRRLRSEEAPESASLSLVAYQRRHVRPHTAAR